MTRRTTQLANKLREECERLARVAEHEANNPERSAEERGAAWDRAKVYWQMASSHAELAASSEAVRADEAEGRASEAEERAGQYVGQNKGPQGKTLDRITFALSMKEERPSYNTTRLAKAIYLADRGKELWSSERQVRNFLYSNTFKKRCHK